MNIQRLNTTKYENYHDNHSAAVGRNQFLPLNLPAGGQGH